VLREIFVPKTGEVIGGYRKLDNEEIHNLYFSANGDIILKLRKMISGEGFNIGQMWQGRDMNTKYILI
jgi:hypothetical protein